MPIIDFSGGYSDPNAALTLKALQDRRAKLAAATQAAQAPKTVTSVAGGFGNLLNQLGDQMAEGRAAQAETDKRARFAQLLAGGLKTPEAMAEAMNIDPETATKYQEHQWAQGDVQQRQQFETEQQNRLFAEQEKQKATDIQAGKETAATLAAEQEKQKATDIQAGKETATALAAEQEKQKAQQQQLDIEKTKETTQQYGDPVKGTDIGLTGYAGTQLWQKNLATNQWEPAGGSASSMTNSLTAMKDLQTYRTQANSVDNALNTVNEAKELIPKALTGDIGQKVAGFISQFGDAGIGMAEKALGQYGVTRDSIQATIRLNQLLSSEAVQQMRAGLRGATSDREMAKFMSIYASGAADPKTKLQALADTERALLADRNTLDTTLQGFGDPGMKPYSYTSAVPATPDATPATPATPAATPQPMTPEERKKKYGLE